MTEEEVAARTFVYLCEMGFIPPARRAPAAASMRLHKSVLEDAVRRWDARTPARYLPTSDEVFEIAPQDPVRPAGPKAQGRREYENRRLDENGNPERRCARCGLWKPATLDHFGIKERRIGSLRSYCHDCWAQRQARTFLSVARREALGDVVEFTVPRDGDVLGLVCAHCGTPFVEGDKIRVTSIHITHRDCFDDHCSEGEIDAEQQGTDSHAHR